MKILRVTQNLYPAEMGGAPYHVHAMSRDQAAMGHDVTVVTTRTDSTLARREHRTGYEIRRFDTLVSPLGNDIAPGLGRYLRDVGDVDVVHAHSHYYLSSNLAALKRRLGTTPLAITNHGVVSQSAPERLFRWYLKTLGRWTFNSADRVFCYTDVDRNRLYELGVTTALDVIPNGIDTKQFTPEGPPSDLINDEGPVLLSVGRLVRGKRPALALEAFAAFREDTPNATLFLCGDGPLRDRLERNAIELGVAESVTFLGEVPYGEMPGIYRAADVCVFTSRFEGVPRSVLEAMATNTPVVAADLKQLQGSIDHPGCRLVDFSDHTAVLAALDGLVDTGATGARETIEADHEWSKTVTLTTERLGELTR